jgi:hypothetical protein
MKSDQFMKGQYAVDPSKGKDGFMASCFPSLKVVAKKSEFKKINRLFQSETAFLSFDEEMSPSPSAEISLGDLHSARKIA